MPVHDLVRSHLSCPVNPAFLQFTRQFIVHLVFAIQGALNRMVNWVVNRIQGSIESPYEADAQPSELPRGPYRAVVFSMHIPWSHVAIFIQKSHPSISLGNPLGKAGI